LKKTGLLNNLENLDKWDATTTYIFFGSLAIPMLVGLLTLLHKSLNSISVFFIIFLSVIFNLSQKPGLFRIKEKIKCFSHFLFLNDNKINMLRRKARRDNNYKFKIHLRLESILLLSLIFGTAIFYLSPAIGLYIYPGGDEALHGFLTLSIVENNGFSFSTNHPYTNLGFYNFMAGFHAIAAFFYFLTFLPIGLVHLLLYSIYRLLIPLSTFSLVRKVSNDKYVGIVAAFAISFLSRAHSKYFGWSGSNITIVYFISAASIYFLLLDLGTFNKNLFRKICLVLCLIFINLFINYQNLILILTFYFPFLIYEGITKRKFKNLLLFLIIVCSLGLALFSGLYISSFIYNAPLYNRIYKHARDWEKIIIETPKYSWRFKQIPILRGMSLTEALKNSIDLMIRRQGEVLTFLSIVALIGLIFFPQKIAYFFLWFISMAIVTENSPFGLYFIPHPFITNTNPVKLNQLWSLPMACLTGYVFLLFNTALKKGTARLKLKRKLKSIAICLFMIVLLIGTSSTISHHFSNLTKARRHSEVTLEDYKSFTWILENTPANSIFFSTRMDGGAWIPMYTHRSVLPSIQYWSDEHTERLLKLRDDLIKGAVAIDTVRLIKEYNISYVFIGEKTQYGFPPIKKQSLLNTFGVELVYNTTSVWIFRINTEKLCAFSMRQSKDL